MVTEGEEGHLEEGEGEEERQGEGEAVAVLHLGGAEEEEEHQVVREGEGEEGVGPLGVQEGEEGLLQRQVAVSGSPHRPCR